MAGIFGATNSGQVALVGATVKTIWQLIAPTNQRLLLREVSIGFEGVAPTNAPVYCELLIQTTAGTSSALTVNKVHPGDDETLQATALQTFTVEPTASTILYAFFVHPQGSRIWVPPTRVHPIKGGTRFALRCTAPDAVDVVSSLVYEE